MSVSGYRLIFGLKPGFTWLCLSPRTDIPQCKASVRYVLLLSLFYFPKEHINNLVKAKFLKRNNLMYFPETLPLLIYPLAVA